MNCSVNFCHFREGWVQCPCCKIAWLWWWWSWSFPAAWFTICIVICYFTLGGCIGFAIRAVIVTQKYFTLGGCCGFGSTTIVTGFLVLGFSSCFVWSFLRYVSITVRHVFAGTGTCYCFTEYFSLGGCIGSWEIQYIWLLYCLFHFGRVFGCRNEQCYLWWCCHSFELGIGPMVLLRGSLQYDGFFR